MKAKQKTPTPIIATHWTLFFAASLVMFGITSIIVSCTSGSSAGGSSPATGSTVVQYIALAYDSTGSKNQEINYLSSGSDSEWFTPDDTIGSYVSFFYENNRLTREVKYQGPGDDNTWLSGDDNIAHYADFSYDTGNKLIQKIYFKKTDSREEWFIDNTVSFYEQSSYGARGNRILEVRYSGAGPDGIWFNEDDDTSAYTSFMYGVDNKLTREVKFYWSGNDGLWFTNDDDVSSYTTVTNNTQGDLAATETYYGSGSDRVWFTPDDDVLFATTLGYDLSGNKISETRHGGAGKDSVWLTDDDAISHYATLAYDDEGKVIKTISHGSEGSGAEGSNPSSFSIGVFYFPGWPSTSLFWADLKGLPGSRSPGIPWPDRVPILGYYPEEETWVAERHIEWATQYGIDFFAYDWYWECTQTPLEHHAIKAHLRARNKDKLKFSLLWANHDAAPGSLAEFDAIVSFWIDHYFNQPIFYRIDGRPVIFIFSPGGLEQNAAQFGQTAKSLLARADAKAREQGYLGIYFIATTNAQPGDGLEIWLRDMGYSAYSGWNYVLSKDYSRVADYDSMVATYLDFNDAATRTSKLLPYIVPASPGFDDRPWYGDQATVRTNPTPEKFEKMLLGARKLLKSQKTSPRVLMLEAWNEFDEGSYLEPTRQWGMQYLETIKKVFGTSL